MKTLNVISIEKQYQTDGHAPYLVLTEDFEKYVLKTPRYTLDKASIQREIICHFFLQSWNISTPSIALLSIENKLLKNGISNSDLLPFHFGSKHLENSIDAQKMFGLSKKVNRKQIHNLNDIFKIAYFDIWTSNGDRKPSNQNLLFSPSGNKLILTAIDHAATFESIAFKDLNPKWGANFSDNDSILYLDYVKYLLPKKKHLNTWQKEFLDKTYLCIEYVKHNFDEILAKIPVELRLSESESESLKRYLFNEERIQKVKETFIRIVADIIS
ncbi:MAG: hypothetical protein RIC95_06220 [Vicingaceae bacterium]